MYVRTHNLDFIYLGNSLVFHVFNNTLQGYVDLPLVTVVMFPGGLQLPFSYDRDYVISPPCMPGPTVEDSASCTKVRHKNGLSIV